MRLLAVRIRGAYVAQGISVAGSACLTLASTPFISASERGQLAAFLIYATLGSYFASMGLPSRMLKLGAQGNSAQAPALIIRAVPGFFLFSLVTATLGQASGFGDLGFVLSALGGSAMMIGAIFNMVSWHEYGLDRYFRSTSLRGIIPGAAFVGLIYSTITDTGSPMIVAATCYLAALLTSVALLTASLVRARGQKLVPSFGYHLRSGAKFFTMQGAALLWLRAPILLGALTLEPAIVGLLSLALSIAEIQSQLPQMRAAITFTEANRSDAPVLTTDHLKHIGFLLVPGAVGGIALAAVLTRFLATEYEALLQMVVLALPGCAAFAVASSALNVLSAQSRESKAAATMLLCLLPTSAILVLLATTVPAGAIGAWSLGACATVGLLVRRAMINPLDVIRAEP